MAGILDVIASLNGSNIFFSPSTAATSASLDAYDLDNNDFGEDLHAGQSPPGVPAAAALENVVSSTLVAEKCIAEVADHIIVTVTGPLRRGPKSSRTEKENTRMQQLWEDRAQSQEMLRGRIR